MRGGLAAAAAHPWSGRRRGQVCGTTLGSRCVLCCSCVCVCVYVCVLHGPLPLTGAPRQSKRAGLYPPQACMGMNIVVEVPVLQLSALRKLLSCQSYILLHPTSCSPPGIGLCHGLVGFFREACRMHGQLKSAARRAGSVLGPTSTFQ